MNYPGGIKKQTKQDINYAKRGQSLEADLNLTNSYYQHQGLALIYKKPTPIQVINVTSNQQKSPLITKACFKTPSTTDYNGLYRGRYLDFEAKETRNKQSFPLSNIHEHQLKHLNAVIKHGGLSFIIIRWCYYQETYLLESKTLFKYIKQSKKQSLPYTFFKTNGYLIKEQYQPRLDYLKIIDLFIKEEKK